MEQFRKYLSDGAIIYPGGDRFLILTKPERFNDLLARFEEMKDEQARTILTRFANYSYYVEVEEGDPFCLPVGVLGHIWGERLVSRVEILGVLDKQEHPEEVNYDTEENSSKPCDFYLIRMEKKDQGEKIPERIQGKKTEIVWRRRIPIGYGLEECLLKLEQAEE